MLTWLIKYHLWYWHLHKCAKFLMKSCTKSQKLVIWTVEECSSGYGFVYAVSGCLSRCRWTVPPDSKQYSKWLTQMTNWLVKTRWLMVSPSRSTWAIFWPRIIMWSAPSLLSWLEGRVSFQRTGTVVSTIFLIKARDFVPLCSRCKKHSSWSSLMSRVPLVLAVSRWREIW